ncbi:hypothetical protein Ait01nite_025290 [Actinoplanes italicus]|uniref:Uncharacterized protein n=1 Tax=Actinoplanes italicus TaxID=113567 RepID=A0A2T0KFE7_9ACTN|nr:hypothetical protein [Actinoplanes italicus]PRX22100.1 hypothetical protein CLV67_105277 [Actinoplanes italicus]GIE29484.1 hypothetical protein Ait01nite_025290 [Actinoplanes italicus]
MGDFRIKIFPGPGNAGLPSLLTVLLLVVLTIANPEGMAEAVKRTAVSLFELLVNIVKAIFGVD